MITIVFVFLICLFTASLTGVWGVILSWSVIAIGAIILFLPFEGYESECIKEIELLPLRRLTNGEDKYFLEKSKC